jgi:hypothetical protein
MKSATEVLISGCSAGGLGVLLGLDAMADMIHEANRSIKVRGLTNSGYFVDYTGDQYYVKREDWKEEAVFNGILDYSGNMRKVFTFANMSAGAHPTCLQQHDRLKTTHWNYTKFAPITKCVFAKNTIGHIKTPLFMLQPRFDQWQIWHVFGGPYNYSLINALGEHIVNHITSDLLNRPQHGVFFDACTHHCTSCSNYGEDSWHGSRIRSSYNQSSGMMSLTPAQAFERWYQDREIDELALQDDQHVQSSEEVSYRRHFHIQLGSYPCSSCCLCHA